MPLRGNARSCVVVLAACIAFTGCFNSNGISRTLKIDGSSTVYPISAAVAEEFHAAHPAARLTVGYSGTGGGMKKFSVGQIDICDASREMNRRESEACAENGIKYLELHIAYDGLAVVVNSKNEWCDELTVEQLREIWRPGSAIRKWSDINLEWPEKEIVLFGPGTESGTFDFFTHEIVGEEKSCRADYAASEDDNFLVNGVQSDRYALSYFGYAYYEANRDRLKLIGIDAGKGAVRPSPKTVRDGTYSPLSRPLFIYVSKASLQWPEASEFVRFYVDHANALARSVGYFPVTTDQLKGNQQRLEKLLTQSTAPNQPGAGSGRGS